MLLCMTSKPRLPFLDWWLLMMSPKPFRAQKVLVTFQANWAVTPPRGEECTPKVFGSADFPSSIGSDQRMLKIQLFSLARIFSDVSGREMFQRSLSPHLPSPMPPCTTRIRLPTRQAMGRRSKALCISPNILRPKSAPRSRKHSLLKPYFSFIKRSSWFPRISQTLSGSITFSASRSPTSSSWCRPRSTKSPLKTKVVPSLPGMP
mmetsp:Transcript_32506/g.52301  ORF Transcript_32506/g.52301 Transcript_32506/m.52301 type:complete len:205 (-) Transcript_32506:1361-1975(-)